MSGYCKSTPLASEMFIITFTGGIDIIAQQDSYLIHTGASPELNDLEKMASSSLIVVGFSKRNFFH